MTKRLMAVLIGLVMTTAAAAEEETASYPPAVQRVVDQGVEITSKFDAPGGLTGYAAKNNGKDLIFYSTADGQYIVLGPVIDAEGRNLSARHAEQHLPGPDWEEAWKTAEEDGHWIAVGSDDPERIIYTFTDPNCSFCNLFWRATSDYFDDGLQVRHLLVGLIKPSSTPKGAAILAADNPAEKLARHENNFDQGGIEVADTPDGQAMSRVQANTRMMRQLGLTGTPATLYRDSEGKARMVSGMPRLSRLQAILRLPTQEHDDPKLAPYAN